MSIEELEAESGRIYDIIADIEAGEPPSLDDVQWMIQRIAELAHLKNLVHGGNRQIKEETKANWRNLNPDVPESYGKKAAIGGGEKD